MATKHDALPELGLLLGLLDEAFEKKAWHGPNLRGALRGISAAQASWRPAPGRHSIRDLTLHAAYWKYAVRRRLLVEKRGSFALAGSNWFAQPGEISGSQWKTEVALLASEHKKLRAAVAALAESALGDGKHRDDTIRLIRGIAAHDLYHAGQVQLLKRLCPLR